MRFFARIVTLGLALGATLPRAAASRPGPHEPRAVARPSVPHTLAGTGPDLARPRGVAVEADGALVTVDIGRNALLRVDPATGARQVVSDFRTGTGPAFRLPLDVAAMAGGALVVHDGSTVVNDPVLLDVDPLTGDRTLLSGATRGMGPRLMSPRGIAADGNSILVADAGEHAVLRVDGTTGDRTVVSGCTQVSGLPPACIGPVIGTGPALSGLGPVAVEHAGTLLVTQSGQLLRVDPQSGDRTLVSDATRGSGPPMDDCGGPAVEPTGSVLVRCRGGATGPGVMRIDAATGDRVILSNASTGTGPAFEAVDGLAIEATGTAIASDSVQGAILRVAPDTGARTRVSGGPIGGGPMVQCPAGLAIDGGSLFVADECLHAILRLDPATGDRTIVSRAGKGTGPLLRGLQGLVRESSGTLLVVQAAGVLRVDPATGNRTLLSSNSKGGGQRFSGPRSIAVEPTGSALVGCHLLFCAAIFCTPEFAWEVVRVDAETGDRSLLSGGGLRGRNHGSGPFVDSSRFIVVRSSGEILAVANEGQIVRVDPVSGDRTLVWDGGAPLSFPGGIAQEGTGSLVITSYGAVVRFDPPTGVPAVVSDATHGAGPFLQQPGFIAVQPDGTLIVVDHSVITGAGSVLRVEPIGGDRSYVAR